MRRMLRILFWLGLGLSMILFVGTVVLWARSLGHAEGWFFYAFEANPDWMGGVWNGHGTYREWHVRAVDGRVALGAAAMCPWPDEKRATMYLREPITPNYVYLETEAYRPLDSPTTATIVNQTWHFAGALYVYRRDQVFPWVGEPHVEVRIIAIPFWMLAMVFGAWPLGLVAMRLLRRKRFDKGLCPKCGYDLRATPDGCPECGAGIVGNKP